jgi:hypothetical protein
VKIVESGTHGNGQLIAKTNAQLYQDSSDSETEKSSSDMTYRNHNSMLAGKGNTVGKSVECGCPCVYVGWVSVCDGGRDCMGWWGEVGV